MRFTWRRRYVLTVAEVAMSNELPANYRFTVHSWFCSKNNLFRAVSNGRVSAAAYCTRYCRFGVLVGAQK